MNERGRRSEIIPGRQAAWSAAEAISGVLRAISPGKEKQTPEEEGASDFRALQAVERRLDQTFRAFESGSGLPESLRHYQRVVADLRKKIAGRLEKEGKRGDRYRAGYESAVQVDRLLRQ